VERVGRWATAGAVAALTVLAPAAAAADDEVPLPPPPILPPAEGQPAPQQFNVTYRARVDGLARGALVSYRINDNQVNSADPTMLPGRTFEATAVLSDPDEAGMRISIQWPYSANLHCEILINDQTVVQADQFIAPRLTPARDDPDYGAMNCGAPLSNALGVPAPEDFEPLPGDPATVPPDPATTPPSEAPPLEPPPLDPPSLYPPPPAEFGTPV
jgi:hypothetical protein